MLLEVVQHTSLVSVTQMFRLYQCGVVADIWHIQEKGRAMSIHYIGILARPILGPVLRKLLAQKWDWRATQWFLMAYSVVISISILLFLPETTHCSVSNIISGTGYAKNDLQR